MTKDEKRNYNYVVKCMEATAKKNGKPVGSFGIDFYNLAKRLHRLDVTIGRLNCDDCNYGLSESEEQNRDRKEKLALKLIEENIGCKAYINRDPRGYAIRMYLVDEDGRKAINQFDGETVALNW